MQKFHRTFGKGAALQNVHSDKSEAHLHMSRGKHHQFFDGQFTTKLVEFSLFMLMLVVVFPRPDWTYQQFLIGAFETRLGASETAVLIFSYLFFVKV